LRLRKTEARSDHDLYLEIENGARGVVDFSDRLYGPMFGPGASCSCRRQDSGAT